MRKVAAVVLVATGAAGAVTTGGAIATYAYRHAGPGPIYALALTDHADGYHSDPGGEFTRIETSPIIGTISVFPPDIFGAIGTGD